MLADLNLTAVVETEPRVTALRTLTTVGTSTLGVERVFDYP